MWQDRLSLPSRSLCSRPPQAMLQLRSRWLQRCLEGRRVLLLSSSHQGWTGAGGEGHSCCQPGRGRHQPPRRALPCQGGTLRPAQMRLQDQHQSQWQQRALHLVCSSLWRALSKQRSSLASLHKV